MEDTKSASYGASRAVQLRWEGVEGDGDSGEVGGGGFQLSREPEAGPALSVWGVAIPVGRGAARGTGHRGVPSSGHLPGQRLLLAGHPGVLLPAPLAAVEGPRGVHPMPQALDARRVMSPLLALHASPHTSHNCTYTRPPMYQHTDIQCMCTTQGSGSRPPRRIRTWKPSPCGSPTQRRCETWSRPTRRQPPDGQPTPRRLGSIQCPA
jgi:hypothetical protein